MLFSFNLKNFFQVFFSLNSFLFIRIQLISLYFQLLQSKCDNNCNGHGLCLNNNICQCYDNWGIGMSRDSGDCYDRTCPFGKGWVDFPDINGLHHRYIECSGKGICNRNDGQCECFPGFEGKSCQRNSCPNDCSGHGVCKFIEDLGYGNVEFDYLHDNFIQELHSFPYYYWDKKKSRSCVCDPGYIEYDCSKRMCPFGNDIMEYFDDTDIIIKYQTQLLHLIAGYTEFSTLTSLQDKTFALTFKSKLNETYTTLPIVFNSNDLTEMANDITRALKQLPTNIISDVDVAISKHGNTDKELLIAIQFSGITTEGSQYLLTIEDQACGDGCTPRLTGIDVRKGNSTESIKSDYGSYECGRRGRCDYSTGICNCFEGFSGPSCSVLSLLK